MVSKCIDLRDFFPAKTLAESQTDTKSFMGMLVKVNFATTEVQAKVIGFFKPSREARVVDLAKVIDEIRKFDSTYLRSAHISQKVATKLPQVIKQTLAGVTAFASERKLTKELLFDMMDANGDGKIEEDEMVDFFTK